MSPQLHETLASVASAMVDARDDWWIIGSAAVALHGVSASTVADVDVLIGEADAAHVVRALGLALRPGTEDPLFRSAIFACWSAPPLPVEFMAGFQARTATSWTAVRPTTRERIDIDGSAIFVPAHAELLDLLALFDRPKDRERARLLTALG